MNIKVKFTEGFKDGTIFPRSYAPGDEAILTQAQLDQVSRSGGRFEVVESVIPNPLKAEKELKQSAKEPNDRYNADNQINDIDTHIPGTEDEVAEIKAKKLVMEAKEVKEEAAKERAESGEKSEEQRDAEEADYLSVANKDEKKKNKRK
jgi:hypothetical protein